jgi:3-oxoacyl-[acyl-carrier protein] reductase
MKLKDKVSLITGASRGIGRAIALAFAKEGSDVAVNYEKNKTRALEVVDEIHQIGHRAIAVRADVASKDQMSEAVSDAIRDLGKIDILVNNAGIDLKRNLLEASKSDWERVLSVNLIGTYHCMQLVAPHMIKQKYGKIVNIVSVAGIGNDVEGQVLYAPSKASVILLTKKFAHELGPYNITVNAIAPGLTITEMLYDERSEEEIRQLIEAKSKLAALRRIGTTEDVAKAALFFASDDSSYITGQLLVVDGGRSDYLSHSI